MNQQRSFLIQQIVWISSGFAVGLATSFLLPFPASLGATMIIFVALSYAIRAWAMRKLKSSYASSLSSQQSFSGTFLGLGPIGKKLEFHCIVCGFCHKKRECPKCGSRAVRVD